MTDYSHLWLFFVLVFGIIVLPGMDMMFIMANALTGGRRAGLVALAGIVVGGICHVLMALLGISVLLKLIPGALNVMLLAGALYIAWIGYAIMRSSSAFGALPQAGERAPWVIFRRAATTCLMNPKAYLFMLAVFPQFLKPEYGLLWVQALVLWLIIAASQIGVYGSLAVAAGEVRRWLETNPKAVIAANRSVGALLMLAAVGTGGSGWHGL
ncbi:MAG TPA: LysE family translocator [Gammaproteobacteria bacterium]|nr:LysE family translocator [Gammaproteobacteria bacterium]